jgi:O-methyltransferase involved in polyketide biosynthesis
MRVAMRRAAHQIFDHPRVLEDPLAVPIIGSEAAAKLASEEQRYGKRIGRSIRAFMAARSRYAEDQLAQAVARGASQM